jgi:hypothetical protein
VPRPACGDDYIDYITVNWADAKSWSTEYSPDGERLLAAWRR